jgi:glycine/D-amino acid oxidase-like deaminating enzyme
VVLQDQIIEANRLVFALGPWARELLPFLEPYLSLERRTVHWLSADTNVYGVEAGFKPFVVYAPDNKWFYGFPANAQGLVKIAEHSTAQPFADWDTLDRTITAKDHEPIERFRSQFLPTLGPIQASGSCVYTMSTDENFIIDRHPDTPTAVMVAGLSGHGYKFAPAIGEALIDMCLEKSPQRDLSFFALSRFGS